MATIINIETSGAMCSVALTRDSVLENEYVEEKEMCHASALAPFVEQALEESHRRGLGIDAVAVSLGPGSYTGLRIGLSLAKGLSYGLNVPLIGVSTLEILAVKAMFRGHHWTGEEILVPMIDARRMEVYTAAYDFALKEVMSPRAMIVETTSFDFLEGRKVYFIGEGSKKTEDVIKLAGAEWLSGLRPSAKDMLALSEKAFREEKFLDKAYSVPIYLKEYQTTTPKNPLFNLGGR